MLRAIVFDLDDTLYPEEQFIFSGFQQVAYYLEIKGIVEAGFLAHLREVYAEGIRGKIFDEALARVGVTPEPELITELVQVYRDHKPRIELYPDARFILNHLDGQYSLGLLSDGYGTVQRNKIAALGLQSCFQASVLSDELGRDCWKPSPEPYRKMLELLAVPANEALYIADNPEKDFVTARDTGWWTVQVKRTEGQYRHIIPRPGYAAHFLIPSLLELTSLSISS